LCTPNNKKGCQGHGDDENLERSQKKTILPRFSGCEGQGEEQISLKKKAQGKRRKKKIKGEKS